MGGEGDQKGEQGRKHVRDARMKGVKALRRSDG